MDGEGKNYVSAEVSDMLGSVSFLSVAYQPLKVFLRVRPFSIAELENHDSQGCVTIEDPQTVVLNAPKESSAMKNSERGIGHSVHRFTFSQVFGPETTQNEFFEGSMKEIVRAYVNGVNGLVFTYGVTNAGKTFTIQGTSKDFGILPRSLDVIFSHIRGRHYLKMKFKPYLSNDVKKLEDAQVKQEEAIKTAILASLKEETESISDTVTNMCDVTSDSSNCTSKSLPSDSLAEKNFVPLDIYRTNIHQRTQASVWISFCEIYNEYVYDLLNVLSTSKTQKRRVLRICEDQGGNSYIKDLKWINIQSTEEACKILKIGNKNRSFACTRMNEQSSRSHSIFSIRLLKLTDEHQPRVLGVSELSFCDLAGSERCNKTQAFGDRLKEAGNINNSLHILGKCIAALKQNQNPKMKPSYIPFRESKLTRLFQPFFCGKGKACMIVNINQHASTYDETLHVMKFSALAKQVIQTILPRSFGCFPPKLVGGKPIMHFDANTSVDDFPDSTETSAEEEVDITILSHEDLLKTTENLKEKLVAERQSKLLLEVKIRREMAEAMFRQLLETEEAWSNRLEDLKDSYEEKLESKFEMYKEAIKKHAYVCAMEQIEDHYVPIEEFLAEQEKVEERESKILQLERQLDEQSGRLLALGNPNSDTPTAENNMELDLMNKTKRANEGLQKQCKEKEELIKSLKFKIQKLNETLLEATEGYRKMAEENSQLKRTIVLKDQEMNSLQNWAKRVLELEETVSSLQKELDEQKKHSSTEEPKRQKPRRGLLANLKSTVTATAGSPLGKGWGKYEDASSSSRKHVLLAHEAKE
ncbi:PREDICTED: kinesin-like protein KIF20A [Cariama cristata]|uniref:kinesin-like protein KIF20A n=1 Tax=Cariama cristata TaxID=54380 RepID=UPI0005202CA9|nr:PREDICTED: kinesin-like protein KIF20A [Cariama cristata]